MKQFAELFVALDSTTKTNARVAAMVDYFRNATAADSAWAIYFLSGEKLQRLIPMKLLRAWAADEAQIETWLFDECYEVVGDLAETMTLILPAPVSSNTEPLSVWVTDRLLPLKSQTESEQQEAITQYWKRLDRDERFVMHKLMTGAFRVGVSQKLVVRALSEFSGVEADALTHRLMGDWQPSAEFFEELLAADVSDAQLSQPYPFYLAHPLESEPAELGDVAEWQIEWKWDGIRAQLIRRAGQTFLWSRGEELISERFPELLSASEQLPDGTVLDGEIVGWKDGHILPFTDLQKRIGRKKPGRKILKDIPASLIAFDLLEWQGTDIRKADQATRRQQLEDLIPQVQHQQDDPTFQISPLLQEPTWQKLAERRSESREQKAEGLMLKRRSGEYRVGRPRGDWWKWKIEPYTVDAVLTYAQRGTGRRASLYTDYTFGVWDGDELVTLAKAYSGLTDEEIVRVDRFVRSNLLERFGPVCRVTPELVFELAFENIQESRRHKSGVAVRFPRIVRWREDLGIQDVDSLSTVKALGEAHG